MKKSIYAALLLMGICVGSFIITSCSKDEKEESQPSEVAQEEDKASESGDGKDGSHEWVDLGLPSGTLWATCNVGASKPEEYGDFFAWGETSPKSGYDWSTYKYCKGTQETLTKYCLDSSCGYNGFTDALSELLPEDDAATANWGNGWQMPSDRQIVELKSKTTMESKTVNGVSGMLITSKSNGKSIFLPAAGYHRWGAIQDVGSDGRYWSRSLNTSDSNYKYTTRAFHLLLSSQYPIEDTFRAVGCSVRPVRKQ